MIKSIEDRVARLECARPATSYPHVIRTALLPTPDELGQMQRNARAGKPFARMPHRCVSMDEWMSRYATQ
jgi:hypothetical protein